MSVLGDIVADLPVAVYRTTPDGRFVAGNQALVDLLGAESFEHLSSIRVNSVYADPYRRKRVLERAREGTLSGTDEFLGRRLNGEVFWVRVRSHTVRGAHGAIEYFEGVMEDVSDLHTAGDRLRRSNAVLDIVTRLQSKFIAGWEEQEVCRGLMDEVLDITDCEWGGIAVIAAGEGQEVLRMRSLAFATEIEPPWATVPEGSADSVEMRFLNEVCATVLTDRVPVTRQDQDLFFHVRGGGTWSPHATSFLAVPILGGDRPLGLMMLANRPGGFDDSTPAVLEPLAATIGTILATFVDRARFEESERQQRMVESLYASVVEQAADAVVTFQDTGVIATANPATGRLVSRAPEHIVGTLFTDYLPVGEIDSAMTRGLVSLETGLPMELDLVRANGTRVPVEATVVRSEFGEHPVTTVILRDIAARKAVEAALQSAKEAAERTAGAKDELLAGMSHELRTPLNSVIGLSTILRKRLPGPLTDKQDEYVAQIEASGRHLLSLIGDILDYAKAETNLFTVDLEATEVAPLVNEAVAMVHEMALSRGLRLSVDVSPGCPSMVADKRRTKQMLINLLSNAVKFTNEGGRIAVRVVPDGRWVRMSVDDTGIGIPADQLEAIFEAFSQVDSSLSKKREGTGLGLSLSRKLAELQGGTLTVESTLGRGSIFTVRLPALPAIMED
jgi:PAS domain S-box-containing protein